MDETEPLAATRSRRVRQISGSIVIIILAVIPIYAVAESWIAVVPLTGGALLMLMCQTLDREDHITIAATTLVMSLTVSPASLQWFDQRIRDASMLAFPVVLMMAGMLLGVRGVLVLLAAMVCYLVFMTLATELYGWRQNKPEYDPFEHLKDAIIRRQKV
jgi:hypothetical protein